MELKRDSLAVQRTVLANRRTLLAYLRTSLMLFATSITFVKLFSDDIVLRLIGWAFAPISIVILVLGVYSFVTFQKKIVQ